ncbi:MAG: hypothetical protein H6605_06480 [Flavobacteriales bacterium]|nr:hypothetical protein [Flavobacteriales bacterium]
MTDIRLILDSIREKTERLVHKNRVLDTENRELIQKINDLEKSLNLQRETIKDLEEKNKLLKIAHSIDSETDDKKELKLKINEFIREIDKTMSLLND